MPPGSSTIESPVAHDGHTRDQAVRQIEIVRRQDDERAGGGEPSQALGHERDGAIVEPGERLVEQDDPRSMQQRAFEREPLAHAAREPGHFVAAALRQARRFERLRDDGDRLDAVQPREELQVLARRQLGIEMELVSEQADAAADLGTRLACQPVAVADDAAGRRHQRGQHADDGGLAGAVGTEQPQNVAGVDGERDARNRPAPAEVTRHVGQLDALEVKAHAAMPARPAGSGLVSSESSAP